MGPWVFQGVSANERWAIEIATAAVRKNLLFNREGSDKKGQLMKTIRLVCSAVLFSVVCVVLSPIAQSAEIRFVYEEGKVKSFFSKGATYKEVFAIASAFAGIRDELIEFPDVHMDMDLKECSWQDVLQRLIDPKYSKVERISEGKIKVSLIR
jgi:hypothetical protein